MVGGSLTAVGKSNTVPRCATGERCTSFNQTRVSQRSAMRGRRDWQYWLSFAPDQTVGACQGKPGGEFMLKMLAMPDFGAPLMAGISPLVRPRVRSIRGTKREVPWEPRVKHGDSTGCYLHQERLDIIWISALTFAGGLVDISKWLPLRCGKSHTIWPNDRSKFPLLKFKRYYVHCKQLPIGMSGAGVNFSRYDTPLNLMCYSLKGSEKHRPMHDAAGANNTIMFRRQVWCLGHRIQLSR